MALPGLDYVVLDANQLTVAATVAELIDEYRRTGTRIVLPWVHAFEQSKGSADWWDKVHAHLRAEPRAVHFAYPSFMVGFNERRTRRPQYTGIRRVEDRRNTVLMRRFLADPSPTRDISVMRAAVERIFRLLHVNDWSKVIVASVTVDTEAEAKAIRRGLQNGDRQPLRDAIVGYCREGRLEKALRHMLSINGMSWRRAAALVRFPSQNALTLLAYMCFGIRRKFQTPKLEPEDNPACDIEAVLIALYGRRLVTLDAGARELEEDLRLIARDVWS